MPRQYLLDTNIVSHVMQGRDAALLQRLTRLQVGQALMSSVTLAEIEYGIQRRGNPERLRNALTEVILRVDVLPWTQEVASHYGKLCTTLEAQGINLSDFDMMIAAHASHHGLTLVSRDKAFAQIPSRLLKLEIW